MDIKYKCDAAGRGLVTCGCGKGQCQLNVHDYYADIVDNDVACDLVEVQFKNTRKGYYRNEAKLNLKKGDIVAVEASPGHDIGIVTLTGRLVALQLKKSPQKEGEELRKVYRIARDADLEKYKEAKALEHATMIESRQIAKALGLAMKIGDVEYQGDGQKAIFYYIAEGRVDFRQLIKELALAFHVRIEMKQIGVRQEAGRIGGFGPCGRELCCSTWMRSFHSVNTSAARYQDLSPNPQKMAGQCAKLRCCMNYEVDQYMEAARRLPSSEVALETEEDTYYFFKADILTGNVTYSTERRTAAGLVTIPASRATEVIALNRQGIKPPSLTAGEGKAKRAENVDLAAQEDLNRFDGRRKKKRKNNHRRDERNSRNRQQGEGRSPRDDER